MCAAASPAPALFDVLQAAFVEHKSLSEPGSEATKARLATLTAQLQSQGICGADALQLLHKYAAQINWQGMAPDVFSAFYRFVYFLCREPGKRNVLAGTAVAAWRLLLCGRFRLLERWCTYITAHHKSSVVLEDTWRQVLDFSRTVHEDLSNYDPTSAWPVLLDEFVEHLRGVHGSRPVEALELLCGGASNRALAAVSPRSGSKRRLPDIGEVLDQLQQLPLGSSSLDQQQQPHALAPAGSGAAAVPAGSAASPSGHSGRAHVTPKRFRLAGPPPAAFKAPAGHAGCDGLLLGSPGLGFGAPMPAGSHSPGSQPAAKSRGMLLQGGRCPWQHLHQQALAAGLGVQQPPQPGGYAPGGAGSARQQPYARPPSAAGGFGSGAGTLQDLPGLPGHCDALQQQQQQPQPQPQPQPPGGCADAAMEPVPEPPHQHHHPQLQPGGPFAPAPPLPPGFGAPQLQHAPGGDGAPLPLLGCAPTGRLGGVGADYRRHSSSNAMMAMVQVTVTEALGLN